MLTLLVASLSAAGAAIVVHDLWRPGTILSAALFPILVSLFDEVLHRPLDRLEAVVRARLSGRRLPSWAHHVSRIRDDPDRWRRAVVTGLVAFLIGAVGLTVVELLLQHSVGNGKDQTTLLGGYVHHTPSVPTETTPPAVTTAKPAPAKHPVRKQHRVHTTTVILPKLKPSTTTTTTTTNTTPTTTVTVTTETSTQPGASTTTSVTTP